MFQGPDRDIRVKRMSELVSRYIGRYVRDYLVSYCIYEVGSKCFIDYTVDQTCVVIHQPPRYQRHPSHKQMQCHKLPVIYKNKEWDGSGMAWQRIWLEM